MDQEEERYESVLQVSSKLGRTYLQESQERINISSIIAFEKETRKTSLIVFFGGFLPQQNLLVFAPH